MNLEQRKFNICQLITWQGLTVKAAECPLVGGRNIEMNRLAEET